MAYVEAQVTALLVVIDAQDDAVTAAFSNTVAVRPLLFPDYASAVPTANYAAISPLAYQQSVDPSSTLDTALEALKTALDTARTGWLAVLTARALIGAAPYTDEEVTAMLTPLDANDDLITAALANVRTARPLLHPDYASAVPAANLLAIQDPGYQQSVEPGSVLSSALDGLRTGLDTAITGFAAILTSRASVAAP